MPVNNHKRPTYNKKGLFTYMNVKKTSVMIYCLVKRPTWVEGDSNIGTREDEYKPVREGP